MARRFVSPESIISVSDTAKTEHDTTLAVQGLLRQAERARADINVFYSMVIRHELTKARLEPAPHQRLLFSFVIHHHKAVVRMPVTTGKTFSMGALALWLLGNDITQRGAIVSASQAQSRKVLSMVADYITEPALNPPLIVVFPWLQKSPRARDPWTQTQITVDRDPGIRDPSLTAVGFDGKIGGSRLAFFVADDLLDDTNTYNEEVRAATESKFDARLMSRLDPVAARAVVTNTPWDRKDLTYHLETESMWPTLTMDIYGNIRCSNCDPGWLAGEATEYIRPSERRVGDQFDWYRLRAHDPDTDEEVPLWPERISLETINEIRYGRGGRGGLLPREFARLYLCDPLADDARRCEAAWIEACKRRGLGMELVERYDGEHPTYTAIDPAVGRKKRNDQTIFFTFEVQPDDSRRILQIEAGRMSGPEIIERMLSHQKRYQSQMWVENNAAQDFLLQFAQEKSKTLHVHAHTTGRQNKWDRDWGVESIFTEMQRGAWIIPCDEAGRCHPQVQRFCDDLQYYQPPPAHTGDYLMAAWIGREAARRSSAQDPPPKTGRRRQMASVGQF